MIPDGWKVGKIKDLNHYITSGSRGWAQYYSDKGDLFVRITNLTREKLSLDLSDSKYVNIPESNSEGKRSKLRQGDILVSATADLGIIGFIANKLTKPAYINQHIALLRINEENISNKFIAYQMASHLGYQQFIGLNDAGAKNGLNLESIRKFSILLPPLSEQCKIAEILGVWDEAIDLLEKLISKARSRKQGLMQQLLTGKRRFKEFEGSEWEKVSIGEIAFIDKRSLNNSTPKDYTFFYISLSDIDNGHISSHLEELCFEQAPSRARRLISNNDILMATVRPNLKSFAIVKTDAEKYVVSTGFAVITAKKGYSPDYLYQYIFSNHIEKQIDALVTGSNYPAINSTEIRNLSVSCPPLPEQEKIAAVLSAADEEISTLEKQLAAYKQQKLGLMQQLLTGKIRVKTS